MTPKMKTEESVLMLKEALDVYTVDELKGLLRLIPTTNKPIRKIELIDEIKGFLLGPGLLSFYDQLETLQKHAISEAIHSQTPIFNAALLKAKYGDVPQFDLKEEDRWSYKRTPTTLQLFFYSESRYADAGMIPQDLKKALMSIVQKPEQLILYGSDEIPEYLKLKDDDFRCRYVGSNVIQIIYRDCERDTLQDLPAILRLVDKGKLSVSEKTLHPTSASIIRIAEILRNGDYYRTGDESEKDYDGEEIGLIKSFAWPMVLQAAKLIELHSKKLELTKSGRSALALPVHETVKLLWERWLKNNLLDELNRVSNIKGQYGKGKRGFTSTQSRRAVIADTLKQCPVSKWISYEEFYRYMQAVGLSIDVTNNPWELYISNQQYGILGEEGEGILSEAYLLTFLFEYASTLGIIDIAYVRPDGAKDYYCDTWGGDNLLYMSRYDGLLYLRLTSLGAWCLGISSSYTPSRIVSKSSLTILPSLQINITNQLSVDEVMLLDTWAEKESDNTWRLNQEKALEAIERGSDIKELSAFLQERDEQSLPETVERFVITTEKQARALVNKGSVLLIECENAQLADTIANHNRMKNLCMRAGKHYLVVKINDEDKFRKTIHQIGYGFPVS